MLPEDFAYFTLITGLLSSFLYVRDTLSGKAKPNRVSWIFWGIAPLVGTYIGYKSGVPIPFLIATFMAGFFCIPVVIASFLSKNGYWKTSIFDIGCGILSAIAIIIWITTKDGIISLSFAILADLFAGIPTIIKSWRHSDTESATPYALGIFNQIVMFLIITDLSFLNFGFPLYFILTNTAIILGVKKKYIFGLFNKPQ
ncbi:MAG: hypothetical protein V4665_04140 [Patescibacteria group bacterium]